LGQCIEIGLVLIAVKDSENLIEGTGLESLVQVTVFKHLFGVLHDLQGLCA
jgi:hypothetical protein